MQQVLNKRCAPAYVVKITLYFVPDGLVDVVIGNQRFHSRPEEVETLIKNFLVQHALNTVLFEKGVRNV